MYCEKCGKQFGGDSRHCESCLALSGQVPATAKIESVKGVFVDGQDSANPSYEKNKPMATVWEKLKERTTDTVHSIKDTAISAKDSVEGFSLSKSVKDFAVKSVHVVSEIDAELTKDKSIYEVASFRVMANAGVVAGMTLDISFSKTTVAKQISNEKRSSLEIKHPITGRIMKVLRSAFGEKEISLIRDPVTGDILEVNVNTGEAVLSKAASK